MKKCNVKFKDSLRLDDLAYFSCVVALPFGHFLFRYLDFMFVFQSVSLEPVGDMDVAKAADTLQENALL